MAQRNTELSRLIDAKTSVISNLSQSVALPLNGAIVAGVTIHIPGTNPLVSALADLEHARAFPDGKQAYGYNYLPQLDSRDSAESWL